MLSWISAFIITQIVEISVGCVLLKTKLVIPSKESAPPKKTGRFVLLFFAASTITHPILWFVLYPWSIDLQLSYNMFIFLGEGYVWLVEGMLYKVAKLPYPFVWSLLLNTSSYVFGTHLLPYLT